MQAPNLYAKHIWSLLVVAYWNTETKKVTLSSKVTVISTSQTHVPGAYSDSISYDVRVIFPFHWSWRTHLEPEE